MMDTLVEQYYEALYRFALSLARREDLAADLTQQTFFLWASKGWQLRDAAKARSWLFTTLYREYLRGHRHETRFPHYDLDQAAGELPHVPASVVDKLDAGVVMAALQRVDETFRVPLALFYVEDFSYKEIAGLLELPIGTVMSRLARGKAQLRALVGEAAAARSRPNVVSFPQTSAAF